MKFKKGFWVSSEQEVIPYLFFEKNKADNFSMNTLDEINIISFSVNSIMSLINNILLVKNNYLNSYEISTNLVTFEISKETVIISNYLFDSFDFTINTDDLIMVLEKKMVFLEKIDQHEIKKNIKECLLKLKKNPIIDEYNCFNITDSNNDFYRFSISRDDLLILDIREYINHISFSKFI